MALYYGLSWDFMGVNGKIWIKLVKIRLYVDNFYIRNKITEFCQMAYKPGSVSTDSGDDHSSWTYVAINL